MSALIEHRFLTTSEIRDALLLVLEAMESPEIDTCGISHTGHVTALAELLGRVSAEVSSIADGTDATNREHLKHCLAQLGESVVSFLTDELRRVRSAAIYPAVQCDEAGHR
jgi:hypothetical protein